MLSCKVSLILVIFIACLYYGETSIVKRAANDSSGSSGGSGSSGDGSSSGGSGSSGDSSSGGSNSSNSSVVSTLDSALGMLPLLGPLIVGVLGLPKAILRMVADTL